MNDYTIRNLVYVEMYGNYHKLDYIKHGTYKIT